MPNQYLPGVIAIPSSLLIVGMTATRPMVVTVTVPPTGVNTYVVGQLVRLTVPRTWGMYQANGLTGKILAIDINAGILFLDIDAQGFDIFVDGSGGPETPASLAPAGSQNLQYDNNTGQIAFQSLNNIGN